MPKETVHDVAGPYDIRVGWSPEPTGHVQVGIEVHAEGESSPTILDVLYGDAEHLERIGREVAEIGRKPLTAEDARAFGREVLGVVQASPYGFTSVWSTMNRHSCNRLIRALRKARDAAFGRDE